MPEKLESVPPVTIVSSIVKLVEYSLNTNVIVAVSPAFIFPEVDTKLVLIDVTVGGIVSIENITVLSISSPSILLFPAESVN